MPPKGSAATFDVNPCDDPYDDSKSLSPRTLERPLDSKSTSIRLRTLERASDSKSKSIGLRTFEKAYDCLSSLSNCVRQLKRTHTPSAQNVIRSDWSNLSKLDQCLPPLHKPVSKRPLATPYPTSSAKKLKIQKEVLIERSTVIDVETDAIESSCLAQKLGDSNNVPPKPRKILPLVTVNNSPNHESPTGDSAQIYVVSQFVFFY
jgi:hypothetical protein